MSVINFDRSQQRLFADPSSVIIVIWHRQKGKDFTAAAKAVASAIETGQSWFIIGMTQSQADETFAKCKKVVESYKLLLKKLYGTDEIHTHDEDFIDYDREIDEAFRSQAHHLYLPNGGRVVSMPGRDPDTIAGRTGNIIMTEFGLYKKGGYAHWDTIFPIITRGGYKMIIITTPRGKNTKAYELFQNQDGLYSIHFCDIYKSVYEEGYQLFDTKGQPFPMRTREEQEHAIAMFRKAYNSESKWAREYECKFTGDLSALVPWAHLERAAELGSGLPFDYVRADNTGHPLGDVWAAMKSEVAQGAGVNLGWDVARTSHLSAVSINFTRASRPRHLRFVVAMHNLPYDEQREFVHAGMALNGASVGAGDNTGLGNESNEMLHRRYKDRWLPFTFTGSGKREVASALATGFSDGMQTLPPFETHKFIATDIYAIQKDDSGGQLVLDETPNPLLEESHCDIAYSVGLNRVAGSRNLYIPPPPPLSHKPRGW